MKKKIILLVAGTLLLSHIAVAQIGTGTFGGAAGTKIKAVLNNVKLMLEMIAGAVATLIIVMNGIRWIGSSDDPGARKKAKEGIVHAVVGLIIVLVAVEIVALIVS